MSRQHVHISENTNGEQERNFLTRLFLSIQMIRNLTSLWDNIFAIEISMIKLVSF